MLQLRLHDSEVDERISNDSMNGEAVRAEVGIRFPPQPKRTSDLKAGPHLPLDCGPGRPAWHHSAQNQATIGLD